MFLDGDRRRSFVGCNRTWIFTRWTFSFVNVSLCPCLFFFHSLFHHSLFYLFIYFFCYSFFFVHTCRVFQISFLIVRSVFLQPLACLLQTFASQRTKRAGDRGEKYIGEELFAYVYVMGLCDNNQGRGFWMMNTTNSSPKYLIKREKKAVDLFWLQKKKKKKK